MAFSFSSILGQYTVVKKHKTALNWSITICKYSFIYLFYFTSTYPCDSDQKNESIKPLTFPLFHFFLPAECGEHNHAKHVMQIFILPEPQKAESPSSLQGWLFSHLAELNLQCQSDALPVYQRPFAIHAFPQNGAVSQAFGVWWAVR